MAGHTVFCHKQRKLITVINKLHTPVEAVRCNRPVGCGLRKALRSFGKFDFSVFTCFYKVSIINILSHEIQRLGNQLHILIGNFRQILCKLLQAFFRIFSQEYRIIKPCHIPGPVIHRLIKAKQYLSCCFHILRFITYRVCHTTGRCIADLNRTTGIFAKINNCLSMCAQCIVCNLKHILIRKM